MTKRSLDVRVPGKLLIAGEYAVLEPHAPAVVAAVSRYLRVRVRPADSGVIDAPDVGIQACHWRLDDGAVRFEREERKLDFVGAAMTRVAQYLRHRGETFQACQLTIESELQSVDGVKFGLGSSAAAVTAVVAAMLIWHQRRSEHPPDERLIFKLAALAHFATQGSGSGVDLAAACFGGWLRYSSYHPDWLRERLDLPLPELLKAPWPFFSVERLSPIPKDLRLVTAWSGEPVQSHAMIRSVQAVRDTSPTAYERFLHDSRISVEHLVAGLQSANPGRVLKALERNRQALLQLGQAASVAIETSPLHRLHVLAAEAGGSGKPSGAGGGDCGIALIFGDHAAEALTHALSQAGLTPLAIAVSDAGVTVERIEW